MDRMIRHALCRPRAARTLLLAAVLAALAMPQRTDAATASITAVPPVGLIRAGDTIAVPVLVDSAGQTINAVTAALRYPTALLRVEDVTREQSFLELWPEAPKADERQGVITFTGGRPGGIVASRATAVTVSFTVLAGGTATLTFDAATTALYLHDGEGTKTEVTAPPAELVLADALVETIALASATHPTPDAWSRGRNVQVSWTALPDADYSYTFSTSPTEQPDDVPEAASGDVRYDALGDGVYYFVVKERRADGAWSPTVQRRFLLDATAPPAFRIVAPDPAATSGVRLLAWVATDATSGVVRYAAHIGGRTLGDVTSPLVVDPAWAGARFELVAFDAAGNSTAVAVDIPAPPRAPFRWLPFLGAAALVLLAALGAFLGFRRLGR